MSVKKKIGIVGLGKMGGGLALNMMEHGWKVSGYNQSPEETKKLVRKGLKGAYSLEELVESLPKPRLVWVMVPAGRPVESVLVGKDGLIDLLSRGDVIIDGGNSLYTLTEKRAKKLKAKGIKFLDAGVSGGPGGARNGACVMVGGDRRLFSKYESLFQGISVKDGYGHMGPSGAGHFVKMVHNGIEYGMMQAIAEGFAIMKKSKFKPNLDEVSRVYNHGSVIESRLIGWMRRALKKFGSDFRSVSGMAKASGEGAWTVKAAHRMGVPDNVIHEALKARNRSAKKPTLQGKIINSLRNQFGGHDVK